MRVLHVSQPTDAGVARCVAAYAAPQDDLQVAVATPGDPLAGWAAAAGAEVLDWPATRSPGPRLMAEVAGLRRIIRAWRPDVVHLHSAKAGLAGRLAVRGTLPTIYQPHAWSFEAVRGPVRRAALGWERAAAGWADVVLCVSAGEMLRGVAHDIQARYRVHPGGVDVARFAPADAADRANSRARHGLGPAPLAVCVGRLTRQKGQDLLLDAWPAVRRQLPDARLVLVGSGPEGDRLGAALPVGASLVGPTRTPQDWYAAADVVVAPSRWEGFSLVPLEAMATARSVVATAVTGMVEAVPAGAGALVRPAADQLAQALHERLADPELAAMEGKVGRQHVERHYDAAQLAAALPAVYRAC